MSKARRSGIVVHSGDVPTIIAMVARGDRRHDIAAWFGLNQGRIKEVEDGLHGPPVASGTGSLPPSGSPGPKARELRHAVETGLRMLKADDARGAERFLRDAVVQFDRNE